MVQEQSPSTVPPTVGIVAALAVLAVVVAPYFRIPAQAASVYYTAPTFVPVHLVVGLFAMVAVVILAAGRNGRTDAPTAAGATVVLGGFMGVLVLWWAIAVGGLVGSLTETASFDYHRWILLAVTIAFVATTGWYARTVV